MATRANTRWTSPPDSRASIYFVHFVTWRTDGDNLSTEPNECQRGGGDGPRVTLVRGSSGFLISSYVILWHLYTLYLRLA